MSYDDLLNECHISKKFGFVLENPVTDLDDAMFCEWKKLCKLTTDGTDFATVSQILENIKEFDVDALKTHEEQRYAKLLLETIAHGYLFMDINVYEKEDRSKVPKTLPPSLERPFVELSDILGMKPVVSYASNVLANVILPEGKENADFIAENLDIIMPRRHLIDSEDTADHLGYNWFFQVAAEIEAAFAPSINAIGAVCYASNHGDKTVDLGDTLAAVIDNCKKAQAGIKKFRVNLNPRVFFYEVRPCLWGYDNLPNGLKIGGEEVKYRGASAAESTSIHVVDVFLDVPWSASQRGFNAASRAIMPSAHRKFIDYIEAALNEDKGALLNRIREHPLFPSAMNAIRDVRSEHVNLVTLFVVMQMKAPVDMPVSPGKMLLEFLKTFRDACSVPESSQ